MKSIQYRLVNNKTGKIEGYLVGKTPNKELIINNGNKTFIIPINSNTESKYKIEVLEVSNK